MKVNIATYIPFEHSDFGYKKVVLDVAREQDKTKLEGALTSVLIYINAVDYIAAHLLDNLAIIKHLITQFELNSIVFVGYSESKRGLPLGAMIKELECYEFPNKKDFLDQLRKFNRIRIKYVHKFLSLAQRDIDNMDRDIDEICISAENLLNVYDLISRGIVQTWSNYVQKLTPQIIEPEKKEVKQ